MNKKLQNSIVLLIITIISMVLFVGSILGNLVSNEIEDEIKIALGSNYRWIIVLLFLGLTIISGYFTWFQWRQGKTNKGETMSFLHQLPELPKNFTGRDEQLKELERQLTKSTTNTFGIFGMGGLGKTTVTVAFAYQTSDKFDAEIFIDMGGMTDRPITSEEVMLHVVRSFSPTYSIQENNSLLIGAYRSILKENKVLLLFDNIRDEKQIQGLIPPTNSILIFTSRKKFSLPDSFFLELPLMSEEEACLLLRKTTNRPNKTETRQIAKLCGYLPNALVKAGSILNERRDLSVGKYISMLLDAEKRIALTDASTSLSYNLLNNQLKTAWKRLSIFPRDFGVEAACFILECSESVCRKILNELTKLSLLTPQLTPPTVPNEYDITESRFKLHELDREFARAKLKKDEQKRLELTLAEYYSTVLNAIFNYFNKGGTDYLVSLSAFDREWVNIENAQRISAKYSRTNDRAAEICISLCTNSPGLLDIRMPKNIIIEWSETALRITRRKRDIINSGVALNNLGTAYSDSLEIEKAIPLLKESIEIAQRTNMPHYLIGRLDNLGNAYRRKGDIENSLKYHMDAYEKAKETNNTNHLMGTLSNIGNVYRDIGDIKNALHYHQLDLKLVREKGITHWETLVLVNLCIDYLIQRNLLRALKNCLLALKHAKELRIASLEAMSLQLLRDMFITMFLNRSGRIEYFRNRSTVGAKNN